MHCATVSASSLTGCRPRCAKWHPACRPIWSARNDQERFLYADPPKSFDRIEEMLPPVLGLLKVVGEQIRRQRSIGLVEKVERLR
jgi:hypothetical protein